MFRTLTQLFTGVYLPHHSDTGKKSVGAPGDGRKGYAVCYAFKRSISKCEDDQLQKLAVDDRASDTLSCKYSNLMEWTALIFKSYQFVMYVMVHVKRFAYVEDVSAAFNVRSCVYVKKEPCRHLAHF